MRPNAGQEAAQLHDVESPRKRASQPTIPRWSAEDCMRPCGRGFIPRPLVLPDRSPDSIATVFQTVCSLSEHPIFTLTRTAAAMAEVRQRLRWRARLSMDWCPWKGLLCNTVFAFVFSNYHVDMFYVHMYIIFYYFVCHVPFWGC